MQFAEGLHYNVKVLYFRNAFYRPTHSGYFCPGIILILQSLAGEKNIFCQSFKFKSINNQ